jgi:rod shape-determining protein MreC
MAIYSVGRRRVILALLLTSALLLTLDLRGNPLIDRARDALGRVMDPVESAVGVVTNPLERAWNGVVNFDEVERENLALQDQLDRLIGTQAAAEAAVLQAQEILALNNLPALSGIDTELAQVIGGAANNIDQVIEINKGRSSGISVGMPVVNQAGLIGKVTSVTDSTARVMLVTDTNYTVGVTVTAAADAAPENAANGDSADGSVVTSPSGLTPEEIEEEGSVTTSTSTTTTTTTVPIGEGGADPPSGPPTPDTTLPGGSDPVIPNFVDPVTGEPLTQEQVLLIAEGEALAAAEAAAAEAAAELAATGTTTTTVPVVVRKEYGALEGRGRRLLPQIRFVEDNPSLAELSIGDLVETAGGSTSLAPPGIPVGRVANRADRPGSGGPLLDVELNADLTRLNYVRVVLYKPLSEVGES